MKIKLSYKEPETNLACYMWTEYYDAETEQEEALESFNTIKAYGYEIVDFRFVTD